MPVALIKRLICCALAGLLAGCASQRPWKFAILSDGRQGARGEPGCTNGVNCDVVRALAADAARQHIKLVLFPGDLVNGRTNFGPLKEQLATWKEAMAPLYDARIPVYAVRGNHELNQDKVRPGGVKAWQSFFSDLPGNGPPDQKELTYKVEYKNACFVGFDQFVGRSKGFDLKEFDGPVNSGMVPPWVIQEIKDAKSQWVFAFAHEMGFLGHHEDCLANVPKERDELWDALGAKHGVYIAGHDHLYVRRTAPDRANRGVLELVVGDGGAPPYPYDHAGLNANYDRHVVPTDLFINGVVTNTAPPNTGGYPMYFGYVVITVKGPKLTGEWRALTNYDTVALAFAPPPAPPRFETLDRFTWEK
jgi:hypothetical protein